MPDDQPSIWPVRVFVSKSSYRSIASSQCQRNNTTNYFSSQIVVNEKLKTNTIGTDYFDVSNLTAMPPSQS